ncbi:hypothetical protein [Shewanella cyperi]|uniref:hypothetical protein n=1 Tax=Shewanella cyperi TaxID=2814292 RepID=UPI001A93FC89|nr:hypothetical protein [Shewanella cyperi]QSX39991.1 hypothetical protein JYB84_13510 [Shewanella cyperi]
MPQPGTGDLPADFQQYARTLGRFKRVARISLVVAALSVASLLLLILAIDDSHQDYQKSIQALALTQRNLGWMMALAGTWLLGATAATTWLITLYSSFRLAGPLYRFTQDLQLREMGSDAPLLHIRRDDYLQEECLLLDETLLQIKLHYAELRDTVEALQRARANLDDAELQRCKHTLNHLASKVITDD